MNFLTQGLVHPWLLGAGLAAISLPVLIHLLNRRRVRVVDWAAMEFLLVAQRKNRRRIRLEDWSLLLLRCLAILCLALLLARPFVSANMTGLSSAVGQEHIVVLDDSLSMHANLGTETAFDRARRRLQDLGEQLSAEQKDHSLTIFRSSQPQKPALASARLSTATARDVDRIVTELQPTQERTQLSRTLEELNAPGDASTLIANRVVYLFTDLRATDWDESTTTQLRKLADHALAIYVVDCANDDDRNLSVMEIRPDSPPTIGVPLAIDVRIKNGGSAPLSDIRVSVTAGKSLPMHSTISRLAPQEISTASFQVHLPTGESGDQPNILTLKAELATSAAAADDRLAPDSIAWFTSPIRNGIRVLFVDGSPHPDESRSQSFYLRRALAPSGPIKSGILVDVVSEDQLESIGLDDYQVVFLLNNTGVGERVAETVNRLDNWVRGGGGLAILPGDQTDAASFNAQFGKSGRGLMQFQLERIQGEDRRERWVQLQMEETNHDLAKHFAGPNNPLLESLKIFRWWQVALAEPATNAHVLARLTNADRSPAIVQSMHGDGQVVSFCFPADAFWTNWPAEPSYVLFMQDLVRWLSSHRNSTAAVTIGEPIQATIDITQYEATATLSDPAELATTVQASPPSDATAGNSTKWQFNSYPTASVGIHELRLRKRDGGNEARILAVNVDPAEGDLRRMAPEKRHSLSSTKIKLLEGEADFTAAVTGSKGELWQLLLFAAVAFLFAEQTLAWRIGRSRS